MKTLQEKEHAKRLIVVLEFAALELVKVGKSRDARQQLLNCDDHATLLKKQQKNPNDYRPDITHQCLLALLDSPLNKAGLLQVYIHTKNNVLIQVHPQIRIPRTFSRFAGLMVQLLDKLSVRAAGDGGAKLLSVIKNPILDHLPSQAPRIGLSSEAAVVSISDWVMDQSPALVPKDGPTVVFIGAMAHGSDNFEYADTKISVSKYPLSASVACGKICCAWERLWGVI